MNKDRVDELVKKVYDGSFKDVSFEERCEFVYAVNELYASEIFEIIKNEFVDGCDLERMRKCPAVETVRLEGESRIHEGYYLYTIEFLNGDEYEVYCDE